MIHDKEELKLQATGKWAGIFSSLAPQMIPSTMKIGKHGKCPIHGGKDGFRLYKDFPETGGGICNTCGPYADGLGLLCWVNDWSFAETLKAVNEYLNGNNQSAKFLSTTPVIERTNKPNARRQQAIDHTLNKIAPNGEAIKAYLKNRGLESLIGRFPEDLKAINSLEYWHEGKSLGSFLTMIGIVRNLAGDVITLHRTYLNGEGFKANVPSPKKLMPPALQGGVSGCAIQLYKPTNKLAITEGIETALAVHLSTGLPVWAAISATMLEKIQVPDSVEEVFIMADKDRSGAGERSANKLAQRLLKERENITVKIHLPPIAIPDGAKSIDWLDVFNIKNLEAVA